jgi:hypothetical protein
MTIFYSLGFETPPSDGLDPCIYIPQEQGGPVITPGTGFHFRSLLQLTGLRWRYSKPSPHGRHLHQHKVGYINEAQDKPSPRVKKNLKKLRIHEAYQLCPCTISQLLLSKSEYYQYISHI